MWLDTQHNPNGIAIQLDPEWPRFRASGINSAPDESDWADFITAFGTASVQHRRKMAGVWAVRATGTARDRASGWTLQGEWLDRSVAALPTPPRDTVALIVASPSIGIPARGLGPADLPDDAAAAESMLRHVAAAQGVEVEQVLTLWLMPVHSAWRYGPWRIPSTTAAKRMKARRPGPLPGEQVIYASVDEQERVRTLTCFEEPIEVFPMIVEPLRAAAVTASTSAKPTTTIMPMSLD